MFEKQLKKLKLFMMLMYAIQLGCSFFITYSTISRISDRQSTYKDFEDFLLGMKKLQQITNLEAVYEIQIVDSTSTCPPTYEKLHFNSWVGTYQGCKNTQKTGIYITDDYIEICNEFAGDTLYESINPPAYFSWKNSSFCVRKTPVLYSYDPLCSTTAYKNCGNYCVPTENECPITDIQIELSGQTLSLGASYTQITGNNYNIYTTKDETKNPFLNFQISKGEAPCFLDKQIKQVTQISSDHILLKQEIKTNCLPYNQYGTIKDTSNEFEVLTVNQLIAEVEKIPELYTIIQTTQGVMQLVSINTITYNSQTCQENIKQIIDSTYPRQQLFLDLYLGSIWALFLVSLVQIFIIIFSLIIWALKRKFEILKNQFQIAQYDPIIYGLGFNCLCLSLPIIILNAILMISLQSYKNNELIQINKLNTDLNCFIDTNLNAFLQKIDEKIVENAFEDLYNFCFMILMVGLSNMVLNMIISLFLYRSYKKLEQKQKQF